MYKIIYYGEKVLRNACQPIQKDEFNEDLIKLANDMYRIMLKARGVGLAANQIGINKQITVIQIKHGERLDLVNPKFEWVNDKMLELQEGCLSIPKLFSIVKRYTTIKVSAFNLFGEKIKFNAKDLLARVIQHEVDHLNGFLYIDRLSKKNQNKLNSTLKKFNPQHVFLNPDEI